MWYIPVHKKESKSLIKNYRPRPQSINCLVCISFILKYGAGRQAEVKKFGFFE